MRHLKLLFIYSISFMACSEQDDMCLNADKGNTLQEACIETPPEGDDVEEERSPTEDVSYTQVLIVSQNIEDMGHPCWGLNPGPDIDYVEKISEGSPVQPKSAYGQTGGICKVERNWASPSEALKRDAAPSNPSEECLLSDPEGGHSKYFYMGVGQPQEDQILRPATGFLVVNFNDPFHKDDIVRVWELNGYVGEGLKRTCTNLTETEPNDKYGVYLVASHVDVDAGVKLTAPDFLYLGESIGVQDFIVP